ncbi:MAG TPA: MgtC/SapB family protein [Blastocatellia bacterium]|nr:MgtC/SapB family protein [Blastocatellia bacterium]
MDWQQQLQIIGEVALAIVLGGLIGLERELADKPAGFRTHMLIAGAAALLTGIGGTLLLFFQPGGDPSFPRADPLRIIEAIVTGVSFIGAGTIIRGRDSQQVEGLTTAASMLFSASLGICVALNLFWLAAGVTGLTLIVLRGEGWVDRYRARKGGSGSGETVRGTSANRNQ